ncbi:hypothetical protein MAR_008938 [Mya arenaria]|uniref:Uncharacterized protein n=1 Tax=Mya arenaria TaxID=6604 RepID=A0ABY7E0B8_MYAAR|nr:cysteine and tyrosine-rich protein 1-like [Mya arenaria]WAR02380.1 hypothetical protein MAR_008938 [Mya arenaria]
MEKYGILCLWFITFIEDVLCGQTCYTGLARSEYCTYGCCDDNYDIYDYCCEPYSWIYGVAVVGFVAVVVVVAVVIFFLKKKQNASRRNVHPQNTTATVSVIQPPPYQAQGQMTPAYQQPGGYSAGPNQIYPPPPPVNYGQQDAAYPPKY